MKSIYHGTAGANCKLRGKLTKMLSCGCCDLHNWKWSERIKEAKKEVDNYYKKLYNKQEGKGNGNEGKLS